MNTVIAFKNWHGASSMTVLDCRFLRIPLSTYPLRIHRWEDDFIVSQVFFVGVCIAKIVPVIVQPT